MSTSFFAPIVKRVKSLGNLRKTKPENALKMKPSLPTLPLTTETYTVRGANQLLDYLDQAQKEADEGIPVLPRKVEIDELPAYYETIEDYFEENNNPAILEPGPSTSQVSPVSAVLIPATQSWMASSTWFTSTIAAFLFMVTVTSVCPHYFL